MFNYLQPGKYAGILVISSKAARSDFPPSRQLIWVYWQTIVLNNFFSLVKLQENVWSFFSDNKKSEFLIQRTQRLWHFQWDFSLPYWILTICKLSMVEFFKWKCFLKVLKVWIYSTFIKFFVYCPGFVTWLSCLCVSSQKPIVSVNCIKNFFEESSSVKRKSWDNVRSNVLLKNISVDKLHLRWVISKLPLHINICSTLRYNYANFQTSSNITLLILSSDTPKHCPWVFLKE